MIDIAPFFEKHGQAPDTAQVARWTFRIADSKVSFSGTLVEVTSTAFLYVHILDLEGAVPALVDYSPMPSIHRVTPLDR